MNISSKLYRCRTTGIPGQVEILHWSSGRSEIVSTDDIPSQIRLDQMSERAFNAAMQAAMDG